MSDEITNAGRKGYCLLWFFLFFFVTTGMILYIYFYNFKFIS